jgi:hypothetical protein
MSRLVVLADAEDSNSRYPMRPQIGCDRHGGGSAGQRDIARK